METDERKQDKIYTIEDVAKALGVSKTTVSRAISGKGRISRKTREKVEAFISEHDYRPNVLAKGLAQSRTYNLGLLLPADYTVTDFPFFKECMEGICEAAAGYNYDILVEILSVHNQDGKLRMVINHKVDGVILSRSMVKDSAALKFLKEKSMPFVMVGTSEDKNILQVDNQNTEGCRELTEILLQKGLRRLALLGGSPEHMVTGSRLAGYLEGHKSCGIKPDSALIFQGIENYVQVSEALEQIIKTGADGIVCMDDVITGMLLGCAQEKNIRIPQDIRVASFYDSKRLELYRPMVTSLHFDTKELGKKACLMLLESLGEKITRQEPNLNYQVILRESTK